MNSVVILKGHEKSITDMISLSVGCGKDCSLGHTVFALKLCKMLHRVILVCKEVQLTVSADILLNFIIPNGYPAAFIRHTTN